MADQLSRSCGTTPDALRRSGVFEAAGGKARLFKPDEITGEWNPIKDDHISLWEGMVRLTGILDSKGADTVAPMMAQLGERIPLDDVRALGFRMFHEAEKRKDTEGAIKFNSLISMWDDLSAKTKKEATNMQENIQGELDVY